MDSSETAGWPASFVRFLDANAIPPSIYSGEPCKYIQYGLSTRCSHLGSACDPEKVSREALEEQFPGIRELGWLPGFYALPPCTKLAHREVYRRGHVLAIDPSSALAVHNLSLSPGEDVLDLCCAPGAKLVLISQKVSQDPTDGRAGSVTGVDISLERLGAAVSLAKRYKLPRLRLFHADGRSFSTKAHQISPTAGEAGAATFNELYPRCTAAPGPPIYSSTAYRRYPGRIVDGGYDRVLVDAQCTHDGSVKHVRKHMATAWAAYDDGHYGVDGLEELYALQLDLIENGFQMVKPGGILVYSTCSLTRSQNEGIITKFMAKHAGTATVEPPIGPSQWQVQFSGYCAIRIWPSVDSGGGFFVCRIRRASTDAHPEPR